MTNAAVYLRISVDATGEHLAVARQREDCRRLAAERGWSVVEEYVDNSVSASKRSVTRPAYDRMVADYQAGRFSALVCWDLDRLTRQPRQLEDWIDAAEERGLLLTTANGEADLSTDGGRLYARIKASVARAEVERKSARQTRAAAQRSERGEPPRGVRLTGYTVAGDVVADEAEHVKEIFKRFQAGDSLRGIAAWLTTEGVPARGGKKWSPSSVRTMLINPRYAGRAIYQGAVTGQKGAWEALVDDVTFDAVQRRLSDPRRITNRVGTDRKHLGSGLYRCGVCDKPTSSFTGGRYRCKDAHITRMGASIDKLVRDVVRERLSRPDVATLLAGPDDTATEHLTNEIKRLRGRLASIESDYDDGLIDGRRYAVARDKALAELVAVEREMSASIGSAGLGAVVNTADPAQAFDDAPLGVQREVVDALLTATLLPARRGHKFDPTTVRFDWKSDHATSS